MKTIIVAVLFGLCGAAQAVENGNIWQVNQDAFAGDLTQETALAYNKTFTYDLAEQGIKKISAVVNYGTAPLTAQTFTDGRTSSGTITISASPIGLLCGTIVTVNAVRFNFGGCPPYSAYTDTKVTVGASTAAAGNNLMTAIKANATLSPLITGTTSFGVLNLTSLKADGEGYALTTSSTFTAVGGNMGLGVLSKVNVTTDKIYIAAHPFTTGLPVIYSGAVVIQPLITQTTYYAIKVDANYIQLATTSAQAVLGDEINISTYAENATETTYTLTMVDFLSEVAVPTFSWQYSNDYSTFFSTFPTVSITTASAATYQTYNFQDVPFRYLRLNFTGPTTGGIALNTWLYLKR